MPMLERVTREITQLHQFFEDWFNGDLDQTDEHFHRFESVLADGFVLVDIGAEMTRRDALLDAIWGHWGHPADEGKTMTIETDDIELLRSEDDHHLATYIERQETDGDSNLRRSSVLFRNDPAHPNGLAWLYVHETPMA